MVVKTNSLKVSLMVLTGSVLIFGAQAQVEPTPVAMSADPGTRASFTTSTITASDTPRTSATAVANDSMKTLMSDATLSPEDVKRILSQAEAASSGTVSLQGLRTTAKQKRSCRHHIFVVDRNGKVLGRLSMPDAWTGSIDIALGKARTSAFFSSDENALSTRQIGQLSQAHGPDGTGPAGGLWGIGDTNHGTGTMEGDKEVERNSVVTFPGGLPLYKGGKLVGGIGVSGDNVDQDESVAFGGAEGYMPPANVGTITPLKPKPVDWFPAK